MGFLVKGKREKFIEVVKLFDKTPSVGMVKETVYWTKLTKTSDIGFLKMATQKCVRSEHYEFHFQDKHTKVVLSGIFVFSRFLLEKSKIFTSRWDPVSQAKILRLKTRWKKS